MKSANRRLVEQRPMRPGIRNNMKRRQVFIFAIIFAAFSFVMWPQNAEACCNCERQVERKLEREWYTKNKSTVKRIVTHLEGEFATHKLFIAGIMWEDNILPAMMLMTEQLSAVAMQQLHVIGSFMDAKIQMQTQRLFQIERAKIHKYYQPSQGMCEFGTAMKSLASSDRRSELTAVLMSQRAQDRNMGNAFTSGYAGENSDKESRLAQFKETYCDFADNNNGLDLLCDGIGGPDPEVRNKDIDYMRVIDEPWTLDVDFTNTDRNIHEEAVLSLGSNLFSHILFKRPPSGSLETPPHGRLSAMQESLMDARSVMAKRSVAQNSYNAITAMKSKGTPGSREFLLSILQELGVATLDEAKIMIGDLPHNGFHDDIGVEPSYYAQMEILTKKLYQNPDFYTNLYDTPTNVDRKGVALQAVGLMQKFDVFKSYLRTEAAVSVLLELAVMEMQQEIENDIAKQTAGGPAPSN